MAKINNAAITCKQTAGFGKKNIVKSGISGSRLDTLAQLGKVADNPHSEDVINLSSTTHLDDIKILKKRAKRKYFGQALTLGLVDASKNNPESALSKSYWNTFHCSSELSVMSDGKLSGKFCKNRWCMVCSAIKIAKSIEKYKPFLDSWKDKHFVTLTVVNPDRHGLKIEIDTMYKSFVKIKDVIKKRHSKGQCDKFVGIRKLECTYNPHTDTYHPHFHLIVDGKENAEFLLNSWLKHHPTSLRRAQDCRPADDNSSLELFKYFAKVISKGDSKNSRAIYADAMDIIFNEVKGKRTFQPFGFKASDLATEEKNEDNNAFAIGVRKWVQELGDWVDEDTGEMLTGYVPGAEIKNLVTNKIIVRNSYHSPILNENTS